MCTHGFFNGGMACCHVIVGVLWAWGLAIILHDGILRGIAMHCNKLLCGIALRCTLPQCTPAQCSNARRLSDEPQALYAMKHLE